MAFFYLFDSCPEFLWISESPVSVRGFMVLFVTPSEKSSGDVLIAFTLLYSGPEVPAD